MNACPLKRRLSFHRRWETARTFGPRHIKTMKGGRPQPNSPVGALSLEHKHYTYTRTQHRENPRRLGSSMGPGSASLHLAHLGATRQSNKCHKKEAGETQGRAPLRGGNRVQVWSCAPCSARAPRGTKRLCRDPRGSKASSMAEHTKSLRAARALWLGVLSKGATAGTPAPTHLPAERSSLLAPGAAARTIPGEFAGSLKRGPRDRGSEEEALTSCRQDRLRIPKSK